MRTTVGIMLLVACLLAPATAQGTVVYVIQGGGGQFTTITEALLYAPDGAYIRVWPGTYSASSGETMPLQMRSGVILQTHHEGLGSVIIDGEGLTRCIEVVNVNYATKIENLIFQNGAAITGSEHGGGMWIGGFESVPSPPPTIRNCIFRNNHANRFGGGAYADETARCAMFNGCRFSNNTALNGGGVFAVGIDPIGLVRCTYDGNSVTGYGGGLLLMQPTSGRDPSRELVIRKQTFVGNSAGLGGSAISTYVHLDLRSSIIAFNTSINDPITCHEYGVIELECNDVFGNAGGDYVGAIAGQLGINGNIWNNPEFCGEGFEPDDPYGLNVGSPCADDNNGYCFHMGARPVKCGIPYLNFNFDWLEYYIPFGEEFCHNLVFENGGDLLLNWQLFAYEG
ncbi:DUF1565 domain-containing protein, partial [bacterium]|nr:DUF1565 domain-containing protein [bacterium]